MDRDAATAIIILLVFVVILGGVFASVTFLPALPTIYSNETYQIQVETQSAGECGLVYLEYRAFVATNRFGDEIFSDDTTRIYLGRADEFRVVNATVTTPYGKFFGIAIDPCLDIGNSVQLIPPRPKNNEITITQIG